MYKYILYLIIPISVGHDYSRSSRSGRKLACTKFKYK